MRLDPDALARFLADAPDWTFSPERGGLISRALVFADFDEAFAFMAQVALVATRLDHHPEWSNVYNRVDVVLTTHDAGGLSVRDVQLSRHIDGIYLPRHAAAAAAGWVVHTSARASRGIPFEEASWTLQIEPSS